MLKNITAWNLEFISELYARFLDVAVYISGVLFLTFIFFQPENIINFELNILIGLILLIKLVESKPKIKKILKTVVLIFNSFIILLFLNLYFNFSSYLKIRFGNAQMFIEEGLGQFESIVVSMIILMIIGMLYMLSFISLVVFVSIKAKNRKFKKFLIVVVIIFMLIMGEVIFNPLESWDMAKLGFLGGFSLLFLHINYFVREILTIIRRKVVRIV